MSGRKIRTGTASGKALVCSTPLSFLGGVDSATGRILDCECESKGQSVAGKVLCFPYGKGSTVGSYSMYQLKLNRMAPCAILNSSAEPIVATGAIMSEIPMMDGVDISLFRPADEVSVDAGQGIVELPHVSEKHVVTSIVRSKGKLLLLQRSSSVGSYRGQWAGVSGFIEPHEQDLAAARRELEEEIGVADAKLVKKLDPARFRDGDVVWCVHPFLFELKGRSVKIDWEHRSYEWVSPEDVARYPTVPGLQKLVSMLLAP